MYKIAYWRPLMGLRDCFDEPGDGLDGTPLGLPPCFENSECLTWEVTPQGKIRGTIAGSELSVFDCVGGVCLHGDPETTADRLAARVDTSGVAESRWARWNPLRRVLNADGKTCLAALPVAVNECVCAEVAACESFVSDGEDGVVQTGCSGAVATTYTNDSAWPLCITPEYTVVSSEMRGGPATFELIPTINSNALATMSMYSTSGATTVQATTQPADDPEHTHDVTVDVTAGAILASYSGTVRGAPIILQPGETIDVSATPQVRLRGDTPSFAVNWGTIRVCLDVSAQINADTIAGVEQLEVAN